MTLRVFTDGGARGNPGPAAAAFVIKDDAGNTRQKCGKPFDFAQGKYLGVATNNEAEYHGVIEALSYLGGLGGLDNSKINLFLDSQLVVSQLNGLWKVKEPRLRDLLLKIHELEQALAPATVTYSYIPRPQNAEADLLVNETLDKHSS